MQHVIVSGVRQAALVETANLLPVAGREGALIHTRSNLRSVGEIADPVDSHDVAAGWTA